MQKRITRLSLHKETLRFAMPEPTSARARSSMSKTAAKRQAHRESRMYSIAGQGWVVSSGVPSSASPLLEARLSYTDARRALAAWRFVRGVELSLSIAEHGSQLGLWRAWSPFFPKHPHDAPTPEAARAAALAHAGRAWDEEHKGRGPS